MMQFLPLMFTFMFATFPAGLVIYWTWNNMLSIAQQWADHAADGREGVVSEPAAPAPRSGPLRRPGQPGGRPPAVRAAGDLRAGRGQARPAAAGGPARGRLRRPLQRRQVEPDQRADRAGQPGAHLATRPAAPSRSTSSTSAGRLILVDLPGYGYAQAPKDRGRALDQAGVRLSARPAQPAAGLPADRRPPRHSSRPTRR